MKSVRTPAVAGMFYSGTASALQDEVNGCLARVEHAPDMQHIAGIIAPHAGYVYSGYTAAFAYQAIKGRSYKTVVILSPSHREYFRGLSIYDGDAYRTPLGDVNVNKEMREFLLAGEEYVYASKLGHGREHAIEVHLPFLQTVLPSFDIVPLVMGDQSNEYIDLLAAKLSQIAADDVLIVASTDLSHFYSQPVADRLDGVFEKHVDNFDAESLKDDLAEKKCEACGGGLVASMLQALKANSDLRTKVLYRTDSSAVSGDYAEVVGYLSAAIYR